MRILVVDDAEDSRDIIEAALLSGGYRDIATAESGHDALRTLGIGRAQGGGLLAADIVLLDVMMPDMDGIETCACIRNDPRYADVPIIMVTSLDDMDSLANAFVAGANDYINKPLNRLELIARVRSALKLKAELERRQARERELLQFLSSWGDKHASVWIDENTGLFVGEAAEAYLTAVSERHPDAESSVVALAVDRLEVIRSAQGEDIARAILSHVGQAVRRVAGTVGVVAASYRNGVITLVVPEHGGKSAQALAENLRQAVAQLRLRNRESIAADHVTATVSVASGRLRDGAERVALFSKAIARAQAAANAGGNRVIVA